MNEPAPLSEGEQRRLRGLDAGALWHPFTQMQAYLDDDPPPPLIVSAEGNWLVAMDGSRYLDANCGYWCQALGARPAAVERAVAAQLQRFSHSTLLGLGHAPAAELAGRLAELAGEPLAHAFFADSGSEAVEVALKIAYQYQVHRGHPERSRFLALGEAYHGDTLGAVSVGGVELFHATYRPLLFPVERVPPPYCFRCPWKKKPESCALECAGALEAALEQHAHELAALIVEPFVLGPGGVIPQPRDYLARSVAAARRHGVPVIFDEVAVGMGRLGRIFAFEELGAKPDLVCVAKGLTAGVVPLSAVLATREIYAAFLGTFGERKTFFHGHTFTGSALGCAAALAALEILGEPEFQRRLREETIPAFWRMLEPLRELPHVGEVRGRGMMAGLELVRDQVAREAFPWARRTGHRVVLAARKRGVNLRAIGDLVLAVPPLTLKPDELALLGRVLGESIRDVAEDSKT
ncbi:MAG: adenosylmethionine--8-amino-7-oxononanoate transaminase [Planctomycetota bacterium]|nr:adenosylmethionine--8-amino-7-oxononanoate transaminase [Planctomycetota bacterium]